MGSKDDAYFEQRAREGQRQVFFAENSPESADWHQEFWNVVKEQGLVPIFYSRVGSDYVPKPGMANTVDNEINEDFYMAKTIVLYFGSPYPGKDHEDHWVLANLNYSHTDQSPRANRNLIIYISKEYPRAILRQRGLESIARVIGGKHDFTAALREDLNRLFS